MSNDTEQQDKTEQATPTRIQKARDDGQIARSRELTTFLMLLAGILSLWMLGGHIKTHMITLIEQAMVFDRQVGFDLKVAIMKFSIAGRSGLIALSPFLLVMVVVALIAPGVLGGWVFSAKSLEPKLSKLSPLAGFKKMLSMQTVIEFLKAIAKSALVGIIALLVLKADIAKVMSVSGMGLEQGLSMMFSVIIKGCALIALSLILVAAIDVPFQMHTHFKKLKMTKEEIKKEHKDTDGDPHVKAKIRAQQQAVAQSRMMANVPTADVIITNPTHFAVALKYGESDSGAPRVVAKGLDKVADRIREIGDENSVPRLEAPPLARALYWNVDIDHEIPAELYTAVAEVLAWVYELQRIKREGGDKPPKPTDLSIPAGMDQRHVREANKGKTN